jgi:hypothetical protein
MSEIREGESMGSYFSVDNIWMEHGKNTYSE